MSWVTGALYANRKLSPSTGTMSNSAIQLLAAGFFSGIVAGIKGELPALWSANIPASAWGGLAYLVIMGSLVAYLSFNWVISGIKVMTPSPVANYLILYCLIPVI